jgi:geranylgeranylglycerol-phosphate geranylgeranyltransferase
MQKTPVLRTTCRGFVSKLSIDLIRKTRGMLQMMRPLNGIMMGFAVVIGEIITCEGQILPYPAIMGFLVGFLLLSSSMIINDLFDVEIDLINQPSKPIPAGIILRSEAIVLSAVFATLGTLLAAMLSQESVLIAVIAFALALLYNSLGKRTGLTGNAMVSFNVAVPFIFGASAVGNVREIIWLFAGMAFLANLGREIIKGIADIRGDSLKGIRTVAARMGISKAAELGGLFQIVAILVSILPIIFSLVSVLYIPFVLASDIGFLSSSLFLIRNPSPERARVMKNISLVWMSLGLLAFLAGTFRL